LSGEEFMERNEQLCMFSCPSPIGGGVLVEFGTFNEAGAYGVEFAVEDAGLNGPSIQQLGIFEAIGPEVAASAVAVIEPFGELTVEVLHEAGDVEQIAVELIPMGGAPVLSFQPPSWSESKLCPFTEFLWIQRAEPLEIEDEVVVVAHELEGGQAAVVELQVELEQRDEATGDPAILEGEVSGVAGDAIQEVIEGGIWTFVSGGSGHGVVSQDSQRVRSL